MDRFHIHGTLLPGSEPQDFWVVDGRITFIEVEGAQTLATDAFVLPGLVDAHCHVGLGLEGAVDDATAREQAATDLASGVMLIRDCGSPADTRFLQDDPTMPRLLRAGRHIARSRRYIRYAAVEVEPEQLVGTVRDEARSGNGWVKLVGDWIERGVGDLAPSFPAEVAAEAIAVAHEEGARVTAHCFGEQAVTELVDAGVDCIEHGTGLDDATIARMAERGVALVPTMINLDNFPTYAAQGAAKFPTYSAHMLDLHARRHATIGAAFDAGVPIYAGTDAGTVVAHGRIVDEIAELARIGGAEFALGAASWRARRWLSADSLGEGASADLIVCSEDPRENIDTLRSPGQLILRGAILGSDV
ncbi:MAG: amidohydrolase family protein [Propionibacterium sp.]|nr:amidohydrolase family protein [Propionibacterium sp.]